MQYRDFGKTGVKISALGFGTMRMPQIQQGEEWFVDEEKAIAMLRRAYELGVNYFDTAYFYNHSKGELTVGKALKGIREKVYLSTKLTTWYVKEKSDYRRLLEDQLRKLDTDYIDFYHFHGLSREMIDNALNKFDLMEDARKAKDEGLIRHISFSFHDKPEVLTELIDTGWFETLLCQYNLLDRSNEEAIAHAAEKGMGVVVMGPVAGGRLAGPSEVLTQGGARTHETALKFVLSNPGVSCVLSGMQNMEMVEDNVKIVSGFESLSAREKKDVKELADRMKDLADIYCTGCSYCLPCTESIKIPDIFRMLINYNVYGLKDLARKEYAALLQKDDPESRPVTACSLCGLCETKCPQKIKIREQLKLADRLLGQHDEEA